MKHTAFVNSITRILVIIISMLISTSASAQYYMNVYQNGGQNYKYEISSIDDVYFYSSSEYDSNHPKVTIQPSETFSNNGLYLGVIGFNQQLYAKQIRRLYSGNKYSFDSFIDNLQIENGTLLFYSVEQAIEALHSVSFPSNLSNAAIITFTDGLDQGSMMKSYQYPTAEDYLTAIHNRITTDKIAGIPLTAYSIGLRGGDVTSTADITRFRNTLKKLASKDSYATEVQNMSEVNARFQEIAGQLNRQINYQTVTLIMPGISNGTRVRFTFDNVSSASSSKIYIEGTFNRSTFILSDVEYHGMTSSSGSEIQGTRDGIFVTYSFEGVQTSDNELLTMDYIKEWYLTSESSWQITSEFDKDQQPEIQTISSSAVIMLVLDCSSSLGSQFTDVKTNAKSFINSLYNSYDNTASGNNQTTYEYVDLGLSVKWATCNVGAENPEDFGDYYAWGETETKTDYNSWPTYKWCNGSLYTFIKYNTSTSYGTIDNKTVLDPEDDVAHVKWGGSWRMPTIEELDELHNSCTWTWYSSGNTEFNGVAGYKLTSNKSGYTDRFIFLPAAGCRYGTSLSNAGECGYYWSSSLLTDYPSGAWWLYFYSGHHSTGDYYRFFGLTVRPVCP